MEELKKDIQDLKNAINLIAKRLDRIEARSVQADIAREKAREQLDNLMALIGYDILNDEEP